ncbi:hypothetical protein N7474_009329 [Penicillium riverlandense]|uniref:uncharacterized protein n=1 Tax=Penicillium riverlandense TaxID=1903569 RepID=UPI0025475D28|nr:uncharacterized protein N7474_009329 [Penicillium riverlandense]KAJ5808060.1 hypothetical protein N7474_009329 [Penicillium riverlandense]
MLSQYVLKKRLQPGELGYYGYQPEFSTIEQRNQDDTQVLEVVRQHANIPVPKLVNRGRGFNADEQIPGITLFDGSVWDSLALRQQDGIKLKVQGYIKDLATVQLPEVSVV